MTSQASQPTTLAEQRALNLSPWRRAFKRRAGRAAWLTCLAASACIGAYAAWALLHLPYDAPVRMLIPREPAPAVLVEVRDAARIAGLDWVRDGLLGPAWHDMAASEQYGPVLSAISTDDPDAPWGGLALALGDDAVVALYPAGAADGSFLLIGAMAPLARLELARIAIAERWPREDGLTHADVEGADVDVYYAARGRLVFASDAPSLAQDALSHMGDGSGFLSPRDDADVSALAARAADQDVGRSGSFYWRTDGGAVLGEVSLHAGDWAATVWVPSAAATTDREAIDAARTAARRAPEASHLVLWHAGLSARTVTDALADHAGVAWLPRPSQLDTPLPLVVTIPGAEAAGGLLPAVAVTAVTPSARAAVDGLVGGETRLTFDGSAVRVTPSDGGATLGVPVGFGLRYPVHMTARPGELTVATTQRALAALDAGGPPALGASTQRQADLFQLVADGPALRGALSRAMGLAKLVGGRAAASPAAALRLMPVLARTRTITANGLTTPDGFRVDVRGSIAAPAASPEAGTP